MDLKRTVMTLAVGIAATCAVVKSTRSGCGDNDTYVQYVNGCEMKMYPVFVEGNRCQAGKYQQCGKVQGTYIDLYDGYSDIEIGSRIHSNSQPVYWIRQQENSDHYWRIDNNGSILGTGLSGMSRGEDITGKETAADLAERTRIYGLLKKCEGTLEMKFEDPF
ncbi:MAG: hypothetical protein Q8R37_02230 [Nanoarchaeota archaeon]|nr:hypothetical protein [Nanoarchaeota archaeon]